MSEIPVHLRPRRLADWLNPTEARKVHSLINTFTCGSACWAFVKAACGKTARAV